MDERVDGSELQPPDEPGSDERLGEQVHEGIRAAATADEPDTEKVSDQEP